jgi:hypothetical protein
MLPLNFLHNKFLKNFAKRYSVSEWYGRLGNNVQQVANCVMLAEKHGVTFEQHLNHDIINKFILKFGKDGINFEGRFFYWSPHVDCKKVKVVGTNEVNLDIDYIYRNIRRVSRDYILPHLNIPKIDTFNEDCLVIHIRGGDNFDRLFTSPTNYVQNPLAFYNSLIPKFKSVHVVVEPNSNNPVVLELQKNSKLTFQSGSLFEDFATLLAAKNLATSGVGTFAIAAALCSENIKNIYSSDAYLKEHLNIEMFYGTDVKIHLTKLSNYIPVYPCSWKNDFIQRKLMMEYQLSGQ